MIKLPKSCTYTQSTGMTQVHFSSEKGSHLLAILTGTNQVQNHCIKENTNLNFTLTNKTKEETLELLKELPFELKEVNLSSKEYWVSFPVTEEKITMLFEKI